MTSVRNIADRRDPRDGYLDAARACILDVGWRRTTLTEVARRAGRQPDDDLPHLAGHEDAARRPDDPRVDGRRRGAAAGRRARPGAGRTGWSRPSGRCARTSCSSGSSSSTPSCCCPTCSRGAAAPRTSSSTCWSTASSEGQAAGEIRAGDPLPIARGAGARRARLRAQRADHGRRAGVRGRPRRRARHAADPGPRPVTGDPDPPGHGRPRPVVRRGRGRARRDRRRAWRSTPSSRGLSVLAVDAHDLAFGTSRWSSKLVHGGLRYLAHGQVGVAHESAVERGMLMETTAPHLTRAAADAAAADAGGVRRGRPRWPGRASPPATCCAGARGTGRETLPAPAAGLGHRGARAGARPAAGRPARRAAVVGRPARGRRPAGDDDRPDRGRPTAPSPHPGAGLAADRHRGVTLRDEPHRRDDDRDAPAAVVNATGVWAGGLVDGVTLRPSRGTHLVLRGADAARPAGPRSPRRSRARPAGS